MFYPIKVLQLYRKLVSDNCCFEFVFHFSLYVISAFMAFTQYHRFISKFSIRTIQILFLKNLIRFSDVIDCNIIETSEIEKVPQI